MVKRRLADLVQEEVTKSPSTIDVTATPVTTSTTDEESSAVLPIESKSTEDAEDKISSKLTPTKPDSEAAIQELNELLAQSRQNEANLQKEVNKLESALDEHRSKAESLSKEVNKLESALDEHRSKAESSSKELKEAKKEVQSAKNAAVQLAESNSQLTDEISSLKNALAQFEQEKEKEKEKEQQIEQQQQKQALAKAPKETSKPVPDYRKSHHALSHRPVDRSPVKPIEESKSNSSPMWLLD
jgi:chromosome segregation ATPase